MNPTHDTTHLQELLERVSALLRSELRAAAGRHGLALPQLRALHYLARCNRYSDTPAAVGEYLGATKGTTSQTLTTLERKGLVEKVKDPEDKRLIHCHLSEAGRALVDQTLPSPLLREVDLPSGLARRLEDWLRALQQASGRRAFGLCHTCAHFTRLPQGFQCGLTGEPLSVDDSRRLCREHTEPDAA